MLWPPSFNLFFILDCPLSGVPSPFMRLPLPPRGVLCRGPGRCYSFSFEPTPPLLEEGISSSLVPLLDSSRNLFFLSNNARWFFHPPPPSWGGEFIHDPSPIFFPFSGVVKAGLLYSQPKPGDLTPSSSLLQFFPFFPPVEKWKEAAERASGGCIFIPPPLISPPPPLLDQPLAFFGEGRGGAFFPPELFC